MNSLKYFAYTLFFSAMFAFPLTGCVEEKSDQTPLKLIEREVTWVKEKPVASTQKEALAIKEDTSQDIEPSDALSERLKTAASISTPITDKSSCLDQVVLQDKARTEVQERGGLWGWFEKHPNIKKYSDRGMQLDSSINKMVFSLRRLCQTAKGAPMNHHAQRIFNDIQNRGEDTVRNELITLGRAPEDVDIWINFAKDSNAITSRNLDYNELGALVAQAKTMNLFYAELSNIAVDTNNAEQSLSSAQTLLTVMKDVLENNSHVAMALKEDNRVPYESPTDM